MSPWLYVLLGLLAVLGRILGQALGARKELANRSRQYRVERLAEAWRTIQLASRDVTSASKRDLEGALRDVELLGTPAQAASATKVVLALDTAAQQAPLLAELLEALRGDLRREMRLGGRVAPLAVRDDAARSEAREPARIVRQRPRLALVHGGRLASP